MLHSNPIQAIPKFLFLIIAGIALIAKTVTAFAAETTNSAPLQLPGTVKMAALLQETILKHELWKNLFQNEARAQHFKGLILTSTNDLQRLENQRNYATELLNWGRSELALQEFQAVEKEYQEKFPDIFTQNKRLFMYTRALCNLRIGEQENCLINHTIDSCLMPVNEAGVHRLTRGSRAAVNILTNLLTEFPRDLASRWLLNVAQMTLGEYPQSVPERWLIPPRAFESEYDIKRFFDVSAPLGLDEEKLSGGVIAEDFDNDGFLDLFVSSIGLQDQLRYYHNNGDGTFTERTREAGLTGLTGGLNIIQTDYNNDGFMDLLVLRGAWMGTEGGYPMSLIKNNGDGTFEDITIQAGLLHFKPTQTAVWFDFNGDGLVDLFVGNESFPGTDNPCELFRNNGNGTFTEVAAEVGIANIGFVKGVASGDFNNDGRPDLYLSRRGQPNVLYRNDGPQSTDKNPAGAWKFTEVTEQAGVAEPIMSFPTWFFDYDNDGWDDLFVCGYGLDSLGEVTADYLGYRGAGVRPKLYHNNRDGTFTDVTTKMRVSKVMTGMGSNFGDLDNDGWLDFYIGTGDPDFSTLMPNRMFRNNEGKAFQDVTTSGGFGHLQKGHAIAFADFDNDGDQDVFANMGGAYMGDTARNALYENPGHGNHWVTLQLRGVKSNRAAIGARIKVTIAVPEGERSIYRTVNSGGSFGSNPLRQQIGLAKATAIKSVEIKWPASGITQIFTNVPMEKFYRITEGEPAIVDLNLKSFKFPPHDAPPPAAKLHKH